MNKKLITLFLAAGCVSGVLAAVPGPAGDFNLSAHWSRSDINGVNAVGLATRGIAMFDTRNDIGAVDRLAEALRAAAATDELSTSERSDIAQALALAKILAGSTNPVETARQWMSNNIASPHRADMSLMLADLLLESGEYGAARDQFDLTDLDALTPALRDNCLYHSAYTDLRLANYIEARAAFSDNELLSSAQYGNAARFYLGYIDYVDGDYRAAQDTWANVNPSTLPGAMADYYRAQIAYLEGRYDDALKLARPLPARTDVAPAFTAEANRVVGESYYQKGDASQAIPYLKKYISATETPERSAQYILGLAQYEDGDYRGAVESLTPVSAENSAMGQSAYLYIGQAMLKLGDDNGAIMAFNRALEMDYDHAVTEVAYYNYAVAKSRGANVPFASSVTTFEGFLQRFPDSRFADDVAQYIVTGYLTDDNYDAALASINKLRHPSANILAAKQKVLYTMGARRLANDRPDDAVKLLRQAAELAQYDAETARETSLVLGEALYRTGDYEGAAAQLLDYIGSTSTAVPNHAVALYDLGYTRMAQKDWDKAGTNFERVIAHPGDLNKTTIADVQARLGDTRYYRRDWAGAADAYDAAYRTNPGAGDYPLFQKAVMQGYQHEYTAKLNTLEQLEEHFGTSAMIPDALMEKAEAYIQLNRTDKANDVYRRLIDEYASTAQGRRAYLYLASNQASAGDVDNAIETYQDLIKAAGTSDEARLADEAVKRLHADRGTLEEYTDFIAEIDGAPTMDAAEAEKLAWNAAEHAYVGGKGTTLLEKYVNDYPNGSYTARALTYLLDSADENENENDAYRWASLLVQNFPDNAAVEDALMVKAEIDYDRGRGMDALEAWELLDQKASSVENKNVARMGIMRVARDTGDATRLRSAADALLKSSTLGAEEKTEAAFSRALAMALDGETDGAITAWKELATAPDDLYGAKAAVYAAEALNAAGRYDESAKLSEAFVNSGTPHTYWLGRGFINLSDAYTGLGRDFEAREYLKALKENYPGDETDIYEMIDERLSK